jgi:hypothetical protein
MSRHEDEPIDFGSVSAGASDRDWFGSPIVVLGLAVSLNEHLQFLTDKSSILLEGYGLLSFHDRVSSIDSDFMRHWIVQRRRFRTFLA